MADYKDIVGTAVRSNAGDLTSAKTGELFYDSTNLNFIYKNPNVTSAGAWRTSGTMNQARRRLAGAGPSTAGLAISGTNDPPYFANVEQYNGSAWTEVNDVNTAKEEHAAAGKSATSIIAFGGNINASPKVTAIAESWNGTSWTEVGDLNSARGELAGAGASNASAIGYGGYSPPGVMNNTEEWTVPEANSTITVS